MAHSFLLGKVSAFPAAAFADRQSGSTAYLHKQAGRFFLDFGVGLLFRDELWELCSRFGGLMARGVRLVYGYL